MEINPTLNFSQKVERIKKTIHSMISNNSIESPDSPSWIWDNFNQQMAHVRELPGEILKLIRIQSEVITGNVPINFINPIRTFPDFKNSSLEKELYHSDPRRSEGNSSPVTTEPYRYYIQGIPEQLHLSEPQLPRETGLAFTQLRYNRKILNPDIIRFQTVLSNMYHMKVIDTLPRDPLILEIGTGYGGFAYQLTKSLTQLGKSSNYILLDLPETLFFSSIFLTLNHPNKKIYIYDTETFTEEFLHQKIYEYDYILLPNYILKDLETLAKIDLMINLNSMQEMLPEQVEKYLKFAKRKLTGFFVSDNFDYFCVKGYSDFRKRVGEISRTFSKYFKLFPSPEFYKKHIRISKYFIYYRKLYFLLLKGKEYPATEFSMRLRNSSTKERGFNICISFTQNGNSIQSRVRQNSKITRNNLSHGIDFILTYLDRGFLSVLLRKMIPSPVGNFLWLSFHMKKLKPKRKKRSEKKEIRKNF